MEKSTKIFGLFLSSFLLLLFFPLSTSQNDLFCNSQDKAILLQIKSHFNGVGQLSDWDPNTDCCTDWPFIGCTSESNPNPGRVTAVTVSGGTGLSGTIPDVIGNLPFLDNLLFFDERKLTGPIPQSFSKLTKLRVLSLNSNSLSGTIPAFLGQLKSLSQVDLSDNSFSGSIPASLGTLPSLSLFNVSHNMLSGSIPNLPKSLTTLDVSFNQLCGAIPAGLKKFDASIFGHNKCICGSPLPACN